MTKRLIAVLVLEAILLAVLGIAGLDMVAHWRVERMGGVNIWAYRGPVMLQKGRDEIRIAVVGGDLAFGWGVAPTETLAPTVRQLVALETDKPGRLLRPVTAVNLGAMGLPVTAYAEWIRRFAYLHPDVLCIVVDPGGRRRAVRWLVPDRRSAAFVAFGYAPMLPLVLDEKGSQRGWPWLRVVGTAAARVDDALGQFLSRDSSAAFELNPAARPYEDALNEAVQAALGVAGRVVIVAPLYEGDADRAEHQAARDLAASRFANARVRLVDLGDEPSMYEDGMTLDGFDFSAAGHGRAAEYVAPAVLELLADSTR